MKSVTYKQNDVVIKEGDIGNELFLVDSGIFKCVIESKKE
jgi:CRP-like cAMP-binding protein